MQDGETDEQPAPRPPRFAANADEGLTLLVGRRPAGVPEGRAFHDQGASEDVPLSGGEEPTRGRQKPRGCESGGRRRSEHESVDGGHSSQANTSGYFESCDAWTISRGQGGLVGDGRPGFAAAGAGRRSGPRLQASSSGGDP
jgi:hypothetical protein